MKLKRIGAAILAAAVAVLTLAVSAFAEATAQTGDDLLELITAEIPAEFDASIIYVEGEGLLDISGEGFDSSENSFADADANLDIDFDGIGYVSEANIEAWRETGVLTFSKLKADFDTTGLTWGMFSHDSEYVQLVKMDDEGEVTYRGVYQITEGEIKKLYDLDTFWTSTDEKGVSVGLEKVYQEITLTQIWGEEVTDNVTNIMVELNLVVTQPDGTRKKTAVAKSNITDSSIVFDWNDENFSYESSSELYTISNYSISVPTDSGRELATVAYSCSPITNSFALVGGWRYGILRYYVDGTSEEIYSEEALLDRTNGDFGGMRTWKSGVLWWDYTPPVAGGTTFHSYNAETGEIESYGFETFEDDKWWFADDSDNWYDWTINPKYLLDAFVADITVTHYVRDIETGEGSTEVVVEGYAVFDNLKDLENWKDKTYYKKIIAYEIGDTYIYIFEDFDGRMGYMYGNGEVLAYFDVAKGFAKNYAPVLKDGKAYLIDKDMNAVSDKIEADGVTSVNDELFIISKDEKYYFVTYDVLVEEPTTEAVLIDYNGGKDLGFEASAEEGVIEEGSKLYVSAVEDKTDDNNFTYNITLKKGDENVQPNGKVTIKIPVPEALKNKTIYVYRVEEDGTYTDMKAAVVDGFVVFTTEHFSEYLLTTEVKGGGNENSGNNSENSSGADGKGDGTPDTGFAGFAVLGVAALAGAAVVVNRKRK